MRKSKQLLLAFYGDDFTGSTDALEFLTRAGARTVLFIEPPTEEQLQQYSGLDAIGIAGMTRSMQPECMEKELRRGFSSIKNLNPKHVHYKVCSTFDSSPQIGSIGKAIEVGVAVFSSAVIPLLVAAPALGRYCVFGNLFARMGIGSSGNIYRLDRHPSMRKHPVTPANESDLRLHLSRQTTKKIGLLDILHVASLEKAKEAVRKNINEGAEIVLIDALYESQIPMIGRLLENWVEDKKTLFSVGSSGVEMALGGYWNEAGIVQPQSNWNSAGKAEAILVASGSCSPVTSGQIDWALANGFQEVALDTAAIACGEKASSVIDACVCAISALLQQGQSVILHTSRGGADERINATERIFHKKGWHEIEARTKSAQLYGTALGAIARNVAAQTKLKRIVIAGGDTSGFAARAMGIEAVEMIAPLAPGAPLCKAFAPGSPIDGLEVNFKGGQVGAEDYFGQVLQGVCQL